MFVPTNETPTIQELSWVAAKAVTMRGGFVIEDILIELHINHNRTLTYRQVRNALFRLRDTMQIRHVQRGGYLWKSAQSSEFKA